MSGREVNSHLADGGAIWIPATYRDDPDFYKRQRKVRALVISVWIVVSFATFCYTWSVMEVYLNAPALPLVSYLGERENELMNMIFIKFGDFVNLMSR
jgi:hypothetical protein